jgi:hypothetical protein
VERHGQTVVEKKEIKTSGFFLADRSNARRPSSRPPTSTRSDADEKSRFSTPDVDEGHFSTLNAGRSKFLTPDVNERHFSTLNADEKSELSTPDIDKKQRGDVATREVEEHNKYFAELYARVFSTLAADERLADDERLAADEKSKGFWAPNADEKSGEHTMPTTTGRSDERLYQMGAGNSSTAERIQTSTMLLKGCSNANASCEMILYSTQYTA